MIITILFKAEARLEGKKKIENKLSTKGVSLPGCGLQLF